MAKSSHPRDKHCRSRSARGSAPAPVGKFECLESRLLLYATTGGIWPHPELITISFMPDGTDIGGTPSALFSTMNARWSTATWQKEILRSLQSWAANANLKFIVVPDDGSPFGSAGSTGTDNNLQGDMNFGDVRIGGLDLGTNLGVALLPPPINADTMAGDFFLNTTTKWSISGDVNLFTVAAHEAGHALGLDHSSYSSAIMYETYNGVKSSMTADDIAGMQAIYGSHSQDSFDAMALNDSRSSASDISSYSDGNKQIRLPGLDIATTADVDWYKITIPSGAASTMTISMQSTNLSLLAPNLALYKSGGSLIKSITGSYGSMVTITRTVSPGQVYYIKADGADASVFGTGTYALLVNMGTATMPAVASPNTATPSTTSTGTSSALSSGGSSQGGLSGLITSLTNEVSGILGPGLSLLQDLVAQGKADWYSDNSEATMDPVVAQSGPGLQDFATTLTVSPIDLGDLKDSADEHSWGCSLQDPWGQTDHGRSEAWCAPKHSLGTYGAASQGVQLFQAGDPNCSRVPRMSHMDHLLADDLDSLLGACDWGQAG